MNNDYTIAEDFTLPSKGLVYNKQVNPNVKLTSMTTRHEILRLSPSQYPYKNLCSILDDCLVEGPGISSYDLCLGDYQFLMYKLRIVTYGPRIYYSTICPVCRQTTKRQLDLDNLRTLEYPDPDNAEAVEEFEKYREFELDKTGHTIRLKFQTPRLIDRVSEKVKEMNSKTEGTQPDQTLLYTIMYMIEELDGHKPDILRLEEFVKKLPMADTNKILNYSKKLNSMIGVDIQIDRLCNICGVTSKHDFKPDSEFFRPALDD